ncbi:MAG: hypothetical protein IJS37_06435 [Bacilli bacterium]|nr:hypothetical protein [Bacilli bacterium]
MKKAIGLRFVPFEEAKHAKNFFLGAPRLPKELVDEFDDTVMFLGMIHLPDIAALDKENKLPHEGYLYFFLDTANSSRHLIPIVRHVTEEPEVIVDDYNLIPEAEFFPNLDKPRGVEFVEVDEDDEGCKLLGVPCDWNYQDAPKDPLLLQISHMDEDLNFLSYLDGFTYIFFGKDGLDGAYAFYEYA